MLEVALIRNNPEFAKQRLAIRNFKHPELIDDLIIWDDKRKEYERKEQEVFAKIRLASKEVGELISKKEFEAAELKKEEVKKLKSVIIPEGLEAQNKIKELLELLPNLPHSSVPPGKTSQENEEVRKGGTNPVLYKGAMPHWDIAKKYDLINFELGNKLTGSGFPVYKNKGAKLQRALIQYFLDYNTAAGYTEYLPPHMVNEATAYGTGQLPDKEGQMYHVPVDGFYLIPTAEVPVTNIYRDEIIKENELPVKMTAYTPCFRREAGSYGKDVRGLNRVHQFDKVEIIQLVHPQKSYDVLEEMVIHVEKLLQSLQLPYRIMRLCGGDMGFTSALTYDFEVYSAAQQKWLEVSSVSNFETFQSNRMKIRFKDMDGKSQLVHSLNGSSLALPRIVAALLENNQKENEIGIPKVLVEYFGEKAVIDKSRHFRARHTLIDEGLYLPSKVKGLIIGTFPRTLIGQKTGKQSEKDINFYYGSNTDFFWEILSSISHIPLDNGSKELEIEQRKKILSTLNLGITDIIREFLSDGQTKHLVFNEKVYNNNLPNYIINNENLNTLFFAEKEAEELTLNFLKKENFVNEVSTDKNDKNVKFFTFNYQNSIKRNLKSIRLYNPRRKGIRKEMRIEQYQHYLEEFLNN